MFQVRIHGRGGQGVVTAAELLSLAAFARGAPRPGVPDFRLRAHGSARHRVLPDRRSARSGCASRSPSRTRSSSRTRPCSTRSTSSAGSGRTGTCCINTARSFERARARRSRRASSPGPSADRARRPSSRASTSGGRCRTPAAGRLRRSDRSRLARRRSPTAIRERFAGTCRRGERRGRRSRPRARARALSRSRPMPSQVEGSYAVARAVALCRPEVISAYPISPQTHIVEALSDLVRTGELAPCEYLNVESEFAAMSAAIGASAAGARDLHRDREPGASVHGRGALQRVGARAADRHDGREPRDRRADQHLERPLGRRCRSATPAGSSSTRSRTRRHSTCTSRRSELAEELSLPVMVCMDGFVLTHAVRAGRDPDARSRSTRSFRRSSRGRCSTRTTR